MNNHNFDLMSPEQKASFFTVQFYYPNRPKPIPRHMWRQEYVDREGIDGINLKAAWDKAVKIASDKFGLATTILIYENVKSTCIAKWVTTRVGNNLETINSYIYPPQFTTNDSSNTFPKYIKIILGKEIYFSNNEIVDYRLRNAEFYKLWKSDMKIVNTETPDKDNWKLTPAQLRERANVLRNKIAGIQKGIEIINKELIE